MQEAPKAPLQADMVICLLQTVLFLMCMHMCSIVLQAIAPSFCITDRPASGTNQAADPCANRQLINAMQSAASSSASPPARCLHVTAELEEKNRSGWDNDDASMSALAHL